MRVSPPRISYEASRSPRPPAAEPGSDAHRQTGFVLGAEVETVLNALALEGDLAERLSGAKFRKLDIAAVLAFASRSWLSRLEALHAMEVGNYVSAFPLLRASADYCAAFCSMLGPSADEWTEWAASGGIARAPEQHALEYRLHPFRSAEELARNQALARVYREASALALPHFGATVLLTANDSDQDRLAVTFGDRDFHVGLAELVLGLLAALSREHFRALVDASERLNLAEALPGISGSLERIDSLIDRPDRCRLVPLEVDGRERTVIEGFRRAAGAAATRVLL